MGKKSTLTRRPKGAPAPAGSPLSSPAREEGYFPVVGLGASAGGLPALEQFMRRVPEGSGMAFVVVQHQNPARKGIMAELLQRSTAMKVNEVVDGTRVRPDEVYVIPPDRNLSILHGVLHLLAVPPGKGLRLPIDFFLRSLAHDRRDRAIGVILSGMGSDGAEGLRVIREKGGLAVVQQPETAEFDSMPRSAVEAGLADITAAVEEMPEKILGWLRHPSLTQGMDPGTQEKSHHEMDKIVVLLRSHARNDFSCYKRDTLHRRVARRMGLHQISKMTHYIRHLQENPQELDLLSKELLIGVTSFFRDPAAWDQLRQEAIPALLADRPPGEPLRAWVPGCSTGEEAYSLAMVLNEAVDHGRLRQRWPIQIFATDLDHDAIDKARTGLFPATISADVTEDRLKRFFSEEDSGYRVRREIREMVTFAPQNLIMDPPFTRLDILSCRNLLIYLTPEVQKKLISLFHYCLRSGGILFQGSAETVGDGTDLFTPLKGKFRIFQRNESLLRPEAIRFPSSFRLPPVNLAETRPSGLAPASLQVLADKLVLQRYAPPAVLTNDKGDIFYVSGRTGYFLEPPAGKANWNVFAMVCDGMRHGLASAFHQALRHKEPVLLESQKMSSDRGSRMVEVSVQRLEEAGPLNGLVMIVFRDLPAPVAAAAPDSHSRLEELEQALVKAHCEASATHEEMQTSQEELRSANEELQSINEELTTSREELQWMNEELHAVNLELQSKVDELSGISGDLKNLLDSMDIATLFLDRHLNVRRFTPQAAKIIKLIPGDAGRPVTDLVSELSDVTLADDAREVLRTLVPIEQTTATRDGRWFIVRIMPYRTVEDLIDGVVITFTNITAAKTLEGKLRDNQSAPSQNIAEQSMELKLSGEQVAP